MGISKTDTNVKIKDVSSGEDGDVVVTSSDSSGEHVWIVQTHKGRYDYSAGCLLFVDDEEFDYGFQGEDWCPVYENHLFMVLGAVDEFME